MLLINGLPGSGKTTLADGLARALHGHVVSKDSIKEALAEFTPQPGLASLGAIAMEAVWSLAAVAAGIVLVDSWWYRPRDVTLAASGLARVGAARDLEIWCDVPADIARRRYAHRDRAAFHDDLTRLRADWEMWAANATPLGITPCIRVDTSNPVDMADLAATVRDHLSDMSTD